MMQQLQFESSWDKAISKKDRYLIEMLFSETKQDRTKEIFSTPIRHAINYRGELLVTVLLHNGSMESLHFTNRLLTYKTATQVLAAHIFTIPQLIIPPQTSMPWTFIFPSSQKLPEKDGLEPSANLFF